ncbi:hypothetical protein HHK36_018007 [Tetracentron sinense]|uniref:Pollen Ole e 1 allergen and extensin family protein n=1 Tax=Tetracentron sinense TaxID=13715 RepID=A0A834YZ50_TETSI|nr:hypothetical protein HHK36_018007 [Tetracentron sinense]
MAFSGVLTALLFALALAQIELSTCHVVKGTVSCVDCSGHGDLSGIRVLVKCDQVKKLAIATTEDDGSFTTELPSGDSSVSSSNCLAKLLGGPKQLCSSKKSLVSKIASAHDSNSYTISTPLSFFTSCPSKTKISSSPSSSRKNAEGGTAKPEFGSSETIDLPLPPEWGLAPSSYYIPFIPIIGIP